MKYISEKDAQELICAIGHQMSDKGYVAANDGNMSIRVGDNEIYITPTGINKGELIPDILIKMDLEGNILQNPGNMRPTSETKMHLNCYKTNSKLMSTCHTHSQNAMIWACTGVSLDLAIGPEPVGTIGKVPVAPYGCPGSVALSESIKPYTKDYKCCLLSNHGAMSWGYSPKEAWYVMEALDAYAKLCFQIYQMNIKPRILSSIQIEEVIEQCRPSCMTESNRMIGGEKIVNLQSEIKLSDLLNIK